VKCNKVRASMYSQCCCPKPRADVRVFTDSGRGQGNAFGQVQEGQQLFVVDGKPVKGKDMDGTTEMMCGQHGASVGH
jgi:hypothetical protein